MNKEELYAQSSIMLKSLLEGEHDRIANLANTAALIHEQFGFFWVGFYLVKKDELVLGPFQGPVACTRIGRGKGVCGASWAEARTLSVKDVHEFPGHIACNALSRSEVVIPITSSHGVEMVLDVDSEHLAHFEEIDVKGLEALAKILENHLFCTA